MYSPDSCILLLCIPPLNATGGRWGLKGSFHFILTMISTLSWTIDNVENDTLTDELEHPLRHRLYLAQPHVDSPVLLPAVIRQEAQPSQDGPHCSVLRVDTTH